MIVRRAIYLSILLPLALGSWNTPTARGEEWLSRWEDPAEQRLLDDARDGSLDQHDLFEAALIANGIRGPRRAECLRRFAILKQEAVHRAARESATLDKAARIYALLHDRFLRGMYVADCTSLDRCFDSGDYNCVSATVLFQCLCAAANVPVQAVATPSHVYSRILDEPPLDVQTTCPEWFDFLDQPERLQAALRSTPGYRHDLEPRRIGPAELIAKIYYNDGVASLDRQQFARAERAFRTSLQLDPRDSAARENLLATLNNWALWHCERAEFAEASALILRGLAIDAGYSPFRANDLHVHQRWVQSLCRQARYDAAIELLQQCRRRRPSEPLFDEVQVTVCQLRDARTRAPGSQSLERIEFPHDAEAGCQ